MSQAPNTHNVTMPFGKHKGELLTRVPVSYLRWMANETSMDVKWQELAKAEWERRGDTMPEVELSGHAIDRASLRVRKSWHRTAKSPDEGLYSWLQRMTLEAIQSGEKGKEDNVYFYSGLKFVIAKGNEFPSLKTIMPHGGRALDNIMSPAPNSGHIKYTYLCVDDGGASHLYEVPMLVPIGGQFVCSYGTYRVDEHGDDYIICERLSKEGQEL